MRIPSAVCERHMPVGWFVGRLQWYPVRANFSRYCDRCYFEGRKTITSASALLLRSFT